MIKKNFFLLLALILITNSIRSQELKEKACQQAVFVELMGQSLAYSFNYDRRFFTGDGGLGASIGLGYLPAVDISSILSVPVSINYLLGKKGNYLEIGSGVTYIGKVDHDSFSSVFLTALCIGFRHQPVKKGFLFRANITPFLWFEQNELTAHPYAGISFGYAF
jgi:hypothetical protein